MKKDSKGRRLQRFDSNEDYLQLCGLPRVLAVLRCADTAQVFSYRDIRTHLIDRLSTVGVHDNAKKENTKASQHQTPNNAKSKKQEQQKRLVQCCFCSTRGIFPKRKQEQIKAKQKNKKSCPIARSHHLCRPPQSPLHYPIEAIVAVE